MTYSYHSGANLNYLPNAKIRIKFELETIINLKFLDNVWKFEGRGDPLYLIERRESVFHDGQTATRPSDEAGDAAEPATVHDEPVAGSPSR